MLDLFLETVCEKTKQAEAQERLQGLLNKLPNNVLMKIANCVPMGMGVGGSGCWLDQFRGTPLLDQAIEIERGDLELQMEEAKNRQARSEFDASMPRWEEAEMKRQELQIQRKLLELELAGGGQEGEDLDVPPDMEEEPMPEAAALEAASAAPVPPAVAEEAQEEAVAEGPPAPPKPKAPTTKVTKETTEKPVPEKIDVKSAAARMRFSLAAQSVKEAQLANGARPFQSEKVAGSNKDEKKTAPISFRAGAAVGRHSDIIPAIGGASVGAVAGRIATGHPLGAIPGAVLGALGGRAVGRFGQGMTSGAAHAHPVKEAGMASTVKNLATSSLSAAPSAAPTMRSATNVVAQRGTSGVVKAQGSLGRGLQLLTGSRARALEGQAANRSKVLARNASTGDRVSKEVVFDESVGEGAAQRAIHRSERSIQGAQRGIGRATREAGVERAAVSGARRDAGKVLLGTGFGAGGTMAVGGGDKTAAPISGVASTVAAGSKKIRQAVDAVQAKVVKNNTPMLSRGQKLLAGGAATGTGIGALANRHEKTAEISPERAEQVKEAFGAALMQGLKGIGGFAQTAGKSIAGAARTGGAQAAGQAAANAGRSGLMRATNFVGQNPAAGAALVAAPAAAVGYAAGRQ